MAQNNDAIRFAEMLGYFTRQKQAQEGFPRFVDPWPLEKILTITERRQHGPLLAAVAGGVGGGALGYGLHNLAYKTSSVRNQSSAQIAAALGVVMRKKIAAEKAANAGSALGGAVAGGLSGALMGTGVGGLVGLLREAYRKRKETENSDYVGAIIRNAVGGAAIGGLAGLPLGGASGYAAGQHVENFQNDWEQQQRDFDRRFEQ